jgi:hypothetical protein
MDPPDILHHLVIMADPTVNRIEVFTVRKSFIISINMTGYAINSFVHSALEIDSVNG